MSNKIKNLFIHIKNAWDCWKERQHLVHTDFSIISNNCWGGAIYQRFGLKYTTPTVGLFIMDEDYIKFLENLQSYLTKELVFIQPKQSKYYSYLTAERHREITYPIAQLGDIEIFFMHYQSEKEAKEKWQRRKSRINYNRLLVKMSQRNSNSVEILQRFEQLPYKNKICFTALNFPGKDIIQCPELTTLNIQGGDETSYTLQKVDIYNLLNNIK